jgi:3-oxoadipate enol-lactonase
MKISTNGIDTNYIVEGSGPWITFSHSLACNLHSWDAQAAALSKHFTVLRYDTRGHGQSGAPAGAYTLDMLADDLKALLDGLGVKQTHFVGLSMGGMIGQTFALKYPGMLKSLALCDTTSFYGENALATWMERVKLTQEKGMAAVVDGTLSRWFTEPFRAGHPELMKTVGDMIRNTPVAGYGGCCQALPHINSTARLKEIKCPAIVIVGADDPGTPVAMSRVMHEAMPGSELAIIPSAAHISNIEQPAAFDAALTGFLARVG